jgi:hypothetical protein
MYHVCSHALRSQKESIYGKREERVEGERTSIAGDAGAGLSFNCKL